MAMPEARLISKNQVTEDLMVIKLECIDTSFTFKPGQYCTLGIQGVERAYSIASSPHEEYLEIFVELVPDGELTPKIWELAIDDRVSIRPRAKGIFTLKPDYRHHVMVATVTGVSPYVSMIRNHLNSNDGSERTFYVLLGASYYDELVYDQELQELADHHPSVVQFVPTVSRPDDSRNDKWSGLTGRVNNIVRDQLVTRDLPKTETFIYACGHPGMIESVKEEVVADGWNFIEERFWKE